LCGFTHCPTGPTTIRRTGRVEKCLDGSANAKFLVPLDVQNDRQIAEVIQRTVDEFEQIDFLLHSIAFADREDLQRDTVETSRDGFKLAMDISVYSLIAVCNAARKAFSPRAAVASMTYFGGGSVYRATT
jgi:enoyl-[acyl-carrier protein] reductase I